MIEDIVFSQRHLEVVLGSKQGPDTAKLTYRLLNHTVADRWAGLVDQSNQQGQALTCNYRKAWDQVGQQRVLDELAQTVRAINQRYDRELVMGTTNDQLNALHQQFELYGARPIKKDHDFELHDHMLRLNELIHTVQAFDLPDPTRLCTSDFLPRGSHLMLEPEDYLLMTPDQQWGWIYLGYNTLGKNIMAAALDNDPDIIVSRRDRPQRRFAQEFQMYWSLYPIYSKRVHLHAWWRQNQLSQHRSPTMHLDQLAMGYIPLGRLGLLNDQPLTLTPEEFNCRVWDQFDLVTSAVIA